MAGPPERPVVKLPKSSEVLQSLPRTNGLLEKRAEEMQQYVADDSGDEAESIKTDRSDFTRTSGSAGSSLSQVDVSLGSAQSSHYQEQSLHLHTATEQSADADLSVTSSSATKVSLRVTNDDAQPLSMTLRDADVDTACDAFQGWMAESQKEKALATLSASYLPPAVSTKVRKVSEKKAKQRKRKDLKRLQEAAFEERRRHEEAAASESEAENENKLEDLKKAKLAHANKFEILEAALAAAEKGDGAGELAVGRKQSSGLDKGQAVSASFHEAGLGRSRLRAVTSLRPIPPSVSGAVRRWREVSPCPLAPPPPPLLRMDCNRLRPVTSLTSRPFSPFSNPLTSTLDQARGRLVPSRTLSVRIAP